MDGDLSWAILGAVAGAAIALALVGLVVLFRRRGQVDLVTRLDSAQREVDDLRLRLDIANARLEGHTGRRGETADRTPYVITDVGEATVLLGAADDAAVPGPEPIEVPDRLVLSATFGAPLVKAAALTHGLRRALSAESRNRIRFQMRQEVRAARKRRRQAYKQYQRDVRAAERASEAV